METIRILGIDPALRNTGLAIVEYNSETRELSSPEYCRVLVNPQKYTGKDAILNMLDMMHEASQLKEYQEVDNVIIESPAIMFNKTWSQGVISSIAHISGGAIALFGIHRSYIFRPNEWTKTRKKEVTHNRTQAVLGDFETWHFPKPIKSERYHEHILDAASLALWWITSNYIDDDHYSPSQTDDEQEF